MNAHPLSSPPTSDATQVPRFKIVDGRLEVTNVVIGMTRTAHVPFWHGCSYAAAW